LYCIVLQASGKAPAGNMRIPSGLRHRTRHRTPLASAAILLPMQTDSNTELLRFAEHYRSLYDGELLNLADSMDDLTDVARQALTSELASRGLELPSRPQAATPARKPIDENNWFNAGAIADVGEVPLSSGGSSNFQQIAGQEGTESDEADFTWKTVLCECEEPIQAYALRVVLAKAGIECWVEGVRGGSGLPYPRVLVAADELDAARALADQPIPQEVFDELSQEVPEFDPGTCPACHTPDPVLEDVEPTNQWLCENCGHRWSDPLPEEGK